MPPAGAWCSSSTRRRTSPEVLEHQDRRVDVVRREGPRALRQHDHRPRRRAVRRDRAGRRRGHQRAHHLVTLSGRDISELLAAHGLHPSRALGQNFVVDPNTVRRVPRLAEVGAGDRVVEIGAGLGSLTLALVETGAEVTAIEVDRGLVPVLRNVVEPSGVRVIEADALKADWPTHPRERPVGPGREPSLQRRHATDRRPARRRAADQPHVGDGAARGRGAARRERGRRGVRGGLGEDRVLGSRRDRRSGAADSVPSEAQGRVRARAHRSPRRCLRSAATSIPTGSSPSCGQGSVIAGRCCGDRSRESRRSSRSRRRASHRRARRGARHRRVGSTRPRGCTSWMRSSRRRS